MPDAGQPSQSQAAIDTREPDQGYCRRLLREELARRIHKNPSYSLRSFARALKLPPSTLSDVLSGRRKLPTDRASDIAERIGLEGVAREVFCLWNDLEHTRSETTRATLLQRLASLEPQNDTLQLQLDAFRLIADWYNFPLLELIHAAPTLGPLIWAARLEISEPLVQASIERFLRLKLLHYTDSGLLQKTSPRNWFFSPPNEATVHDLYRTMMSRASESLSRDHADERYYSTHSIVFDHESFSAAQDRIAQFQKEIADLGRAPADSNNARVFQFSIQLFPISRTPKTEVIS